jgi:hypothetical protein
MAEIGKTKRLFAAVLYGRSVPKGSLDQSIDYLRKAVALDPTVIASRLELAKSYVAVENWTLARNFLVSCENFPYSSPTTPTINKKRSSCWKRSRSASAETPNNNPSS